MPRRPLSPEEIKLWRHVVRDVRAYGVPSPAAPAAALPRTPAPAAPAAPAALRHRPPASLTPGLVPGDTANIDGRNARRLKRGALAIDARIDLHGLTLNQAHAALDAFIRGRQSAGARCVLVVTGRGGRGGGPGRIRAEVPAWLNHARLRPLVLAFTEARPQHGGAGALYVLLKRNRKERDA